MLSNPSKNNSTESSQSTVSELEILRLKNSQLKQDNQRLSEDVKHLIKTENELYKTQSKLDKQIKIYQKLYELGKAFNQSFDLDQVLTLSAEFLIYTLNFERCLILLPATSGASLSVKTFEGYYEEPQVDVITALKVPTNDRLFTRLTTTDFTIFNETKAEPLLREWSQSIGMDEYLVFPLYHEDRSALGLIIVGNTAEMYSYQTRIQEEVEEVLGLANLASQIVAAINSINYYNVVKDQQIYLEEQVAARTHVLNRQNQSLETALQDLKRTQAQLVQSEKMSGLGQLVAGIAHEINNPVSFIYGNLNHTETYAQDLLSLVHLYRQQYPDADDDIEVLSDTIDLDFLAEDLPKTIESMKIGASRIKDIVLSLRTFSRMDEAECKAVDIHTGLDSTLMILQHRLKAQPDRPEIPVIKHYGDLPDIECYAGQLNQVFMNILANAIDAIEEFKIESGITIRTQTLEDMVSITIHNEGSAIPESIQKSLFDPFFTTKPVGQGTGMGLSISYQIITERHGGSLVCQSTASEGTSFIITLPIRVSPI